MSRELQEVEAFLRTRLAGALPGAPAQRRFAPVPARTGWEPDQRPSTARQAAALLLIYPGDGGLHVPLTLRPDDLPQHAGQISLPGGGVDAGESSQQAALREAHEEVGVDPGSVRILGRLSTLWVVVSNFLVQPVVGVTDRRPAFQLHAREVARLVEAPLAEIRNPQRLHWQRVTRDGIQVSYPYFDVAEHRVWGATAMILGEFACLWNDAHCPPEILPG